MKRRHELLVFSVATLFTLVSSAYAKSNEESYVLETGKVGFICEGPDISVPAWGRFGTVQGGLSIDPRSLSKVAGNIDVFMVSIRTDDSAWDTMFRRAGFLEIDDLPKSRFVLEAVRGAERLQERKWVPMQLAGQFTLHGITKKIIVPATVKWVPEDPLSGKDERIHVRASFHITWDEYDIAMPTGHTRTFAGDGALIFADLEYSPKKTAGRRRRK